MKPNSILSVITLGLLFMWADASRGDDWPQWRGPNRDGVWRETGKEYWQEPTNTLAQNEVATPVFDQDRLLMSGLS